MLDIQSHIPRLKSKKDGKLLVRIKSHLYLLICSFEIQEITSEILKEKSFVFIEFLDFLNTMYE
jgi:hypothetical protein